MLQTSHMPTLNVTHNNIQHHAKTRKTAPRTPYRTSNSASATNRKAQLQPQKNFSTLILTDPEIIMVILPTCPVFSEG